MNVLSHCRGCGACVPFCPQEAIRLEHGRAVIDTSLCVECLVCVDINVCPEDALKTGDDEDSTLRRRYGQMLDSRQGGEKKRTVDICDVKKCDVSPFPFPEGCVMLEVEAGRPFGGVTLGQLNTLRIALRARGFSCAMRGRHQAFLDPETGLFPEQKAHLRVLYLAQQIAVPVPQLPEVLELLESWAHGEGVCVTLNATLPPALETQVRDTLAACKRPVADRMKANLGWGRPLEN